MFFRLRKFAVVGLNARLGRKIGEGDVRPARASVQWVRIGEGDLRVGGGEAADSLLWENTFVFSGDKGGLADGASGSGRWGKLA